MAIWFTDHQLEDIRKANDVNMMKHLNIEITELGEDFLAGTMPVDHRTQQPFGVLHGGASVVLAESLGSIAANLVLDQSKQYCVGLDINANHLRAIPSGKVTGIAKPLHLGRSTQVWEIKIVADSGKMAAICRLTMAVLNR